MKEENKKKYLAFIDFLKELNQLKNEKSLKCNIKKCEYKFFFCDLNEAKNSKYSYYIKKNENNILSVEYINKCFCPEPPDFIKRQLNCVYNDIHKEFNIDENKLNLTMVEFKEYHSWIEERENWKKDELEKEKVNKIFDYFFDIYQYLKRNDDNELLLGQGILTSSKSDFAEMEYPLLTKKLNISCVENKKIIVKLTDEYIQISNHLLNIININNFDPVLFEELVEEIKESDFELIDNNNDLNNYLIKFAHYIGKNCGYINLDEEQQDLFYNYDYDFEIRNKPVIFTNKIILGYDEICNKIKENAENGIFSEIINKIIMSDEDYNENYSSDSCLDNFVFNPNDILFAKESNKEQFEIAKIINRDNVAVVKGPPGCGKTHTIANLTGYFLSQGKNILITSYKSKALSVLRDKIPENIRNLCVSVLDNSNDILKNSITYISDYVSKNNNNKFVLKEKSHSIENKRKELITEINDYTEKIKTIVNNEYRNIVIEGNSYSIKEAGKFVCKYKEITEKIFPDNMCFNKSFPLTDEELVFLYNSNSISVKEENEMGIDIPLISSFKTPSEFNELVEKYKNLIKEAENLKNILDYDYENKFIKINANNLYNNLTDLEKVKNLIIFIENNKTDDYSWGYYVADCQKYGNKDCKKLSNYIVELNDFAEKNKEYFTDNINGNLRHEKENEIIEILKKKTQKNSLSYNFLFNVSTKRFVRDYLNQLRLDNKQICSNEDVLRLEKLIILAQKRDKVKILWQNIIEKNGGEKFDSFSKPEYTLLRFADIVNKYYDWYPKTFEFVKTNLDIIGYNTDLLFSKNYNKTIVQTENYMDFVNNKLSLILKLSVILFFKLPQFEKDINENIKLFKEENLRLSFCRNLYNSIKNKNSEEYENNYEKYKEFYKKNEDIIKRKSILKKIKDVYQLWEFYISKREGVHASLNVPENIREAWKSKQLLYELNEIKKYNIEEYNNKLIDANKKFRKYTLELIKNNALLYLLDKIGGDEKKYLSEYIQLKRKIGKGTGKFAKKYINELSKIVPKCKECIPVWIMPINEALKTFVMAKKPFDVVIIDEASQSDILSLLMICLAKKAIIVGDKEQVSPTNIGVELDKINNLKDKYISDLDNFKSVDLNTSVYDIVDVIFTTCMLKEHFRCAPEIIGFSNKLCYNNEIIPLRDVSNLNIKPSVVSYRVKNGRRESKFNINEAKCIISLMKACMERPEYDGKTFGIISLLGIEQVKIINKCISKNISVADIEERNVLVGDSANFQGDERDIIFISLVDNNEGDGPLNLRSDTRDIYKQRYNVAVSRAKDQLWVVHSLDEKTDLKKGDLRRQLIEYANNSYKNEINSKFVEEKSESEFEKKVAEYLLNQGYNIDQQYKVGSYRIDIVVKYGDKKIAVECDGDKYHSSNDQIIYDVERQQNLERFGWSFIRIRGSEFFSDPEKTMGNVISQLNSNNIYPEKKEENSFNFILKDEIIRRAEEIFLEIEN